MTAILSRDIRINLILTKSAYSIHIKCKKFRRDKLLDDSEKNSISWRGAILLRNRSRVESSVAEHYRGEGRLCQAVKIGVT